MAVYHDKFIQSEFNHKLYVKGFVCDFKIHSLNLRKGIVEISDSSTDEKFVFEEIETILFSDLVISKNNLLPVITCSDVLYVEAPRLGLSYTIPAGSLIKNDQPLQSGITIDSVSNSKGGKVSFDAKTNLIKFTPQLNHKGVMSFCYHAMENNQLSTDCTPVSLLTPDMPKDPYFADAWWLHITNVPACWQYATGKDVSIAVIDPSMHFKHSDLKVQRALKKSLDTSGGVGAELNWHSLSVAGVIGAQRNGEHTVGVAYDANLYSYDVLHSQGLNYTALTELILSKGHDMLSNSWGANEWFIPEYAYGQAYNDLFERAAKEGRGGKGTAIIFSSGNDGALGESSNYKSHKNSPYVIVVGGVDKSKELWFRDGDERALHSWGGGILVSAPWDNIDVLSITDLSFEDGFTYKSTVAKKSMGTSYAAPIISGIVALMYEANSNLGWRDVQEILAICARFVPVERHMANGAISYWGVNKASHWNGGGMHFSHLHGLGLVDAYCSISFAKTWPLSSTSKNFIQISKSYSHKDKSEQVWDIASFTQEFAVEYAELKFFGGFSQIATANITLISPLMTASRLLDQPSINPLSGKPANPCEVQEHLVRTNMHDGWSLGSVHFRGESGKGTWKLHSSHPDEIQFVTLILYGQQDPISQLVYTNEFSFILNQTESNAGQLNGSLASRKTIKKGPSILNTAGVSDGVTINLKDHSGIIDGQKVILMPDHSITKIITGDGDDRITVGPKGAFEITAGCGSNVIDLFGGKSTARFAPTNCKAKHDTIKNFGLSDKIIIPLQQSIIPEVTGKEIKVAGHAIITFENSDSELACVFKEDAWECTAVCAELQIMRIDDSYKFPIPGVCNVTDHVA